MSFGLRLMRLVTSAPVGRNSLLPPLASFVILMVKMPARSSLLARNALWDPRVIIGVLALPYFASVFPVIASPGMFAAGAGGRVPVGGARVRSVARGAARLSFGNLG